MSKPGSTERLYGVHPVLEALRSQARPCESLYLQQGRRGREVEEIMRLARSRQIPLILRPRELLDQLAGSGRHQGVVAVMAAKAYVELEDLLTAAGEDEPPVLVILDGIEDPHNLGAILRTAEAAGVHGIVLPERRAIGLTPTVVKASAGASEHVRVARVVNLAQAIERVKAAGIWVYALDPKGSRHYLDGDYRGAVALVVGGEGRGIRPLVAEHCDDRIRIPMRGKVANLNASVATAILLYEVRRQREAVRAVMSPVGAE